jgi:hypothetical protein
MADAVESPDARSDVEVVFASLVAERGGRSAFDAVGLAAARGLAAILCAGSPSASALSVLSDMLPSKQESGAPYDLGRLNAKEFRLLDFLLARARGEIKGAPPPRSRSELQAQLLGHALARLEDGCKPVWAVGPRREPTADEVTEIRSLLDSLLWHVGLGNELLWPLERRSDYEALVDRVKRAARESEAAGRGTAPSDEIGTSDAPAAGAGPSAAEGAVVIPISEPWHGYGGGGRRHFGDHPGY